MGKIQDCIDNNDLEKAILGYKNTTCAWAGTWWEAIIEIYRNNAEWRKIYKINEVEKEIEKIENQAENDFFEYALHHKNNYVYFIRLVDNTGSIIWNKIGSTKQTLYSRLKSVLNSSYCKENSIFNYEIIGVWSTAQEAPQGLESYFRAKIIQKYGSENYVPEDRFLIEPSIEQMNEWAKNYLENF